MATQDQLRLDGLLFEPDNKTDAAILHLHGRAGNFYGNHFLASMIDLYPAAGFGFLTVNLRGHDQIADFRIGASQNIRRLGQAYDIFEECVFDIAAWIEFLRARGYQKIILQGHSQGGGKAVYYLNKNKCDDVVAVVLASPADASGLMRKYFTKDFAANLLQANDLVAQGRGSELLAHAIRGFHVSAKSFANEFNPGASADIFPIFDQGDFGRLENLSIPVLAFYGSKEDTIVNSPSQDLAAIATHFKNKRSHNFIMEGADHGYLGFDKQIAAAVIDWINKILRP